MASALRCIDNARLFLRRQARRERVLDRAPWPRTPASSSKSPVTRGWMADMDEPAVIRPEKTFAGITPAGIPTYPTRTRVRPSENLSCIWSNGSIRAHSDCMGAMSGPACSGDRSSRRTFVSMRRPQDPLATGDSKEGGALRRALVAGRAQNERARGWTDTDSQERQRNTQHNDSSSFGIPVWLTAFGKSVLFVIPSFLFWTHFFTSGFYPVSEQELAEERAETRRLYHFFGINELTPEPELDMLWNAKVMALSELSARLVKSPNMIEILGSTDLEVNHVLSPPPPEGSPDALVCNEAEWTPRVVFSSARGIVICYLRFLQHDEKWIPMEVHFVDANLTVDTQVPPWKMEGKLPHGVMYQRMPAKPSNF